jgi:hypothetical protein
LGARGFAVVLLTGTVAVACARGAEPGAATTAKSSPAAQPASSAPTNPTSFWAIIDATTGVPEDVQLRRLRGALDALSPEEIVRYETEFQEHLARSYSWNLWGAAYLMNGGCSDDCFDYFRAWLISRGKAVFDAAVANPDSLAELRDLPQGPEFEEIMYVGGKAYKAKTGDELPATVHSAAKRPELGQGWDFDDEAEMTRRYPKLSKRVRGR